MEDSDKAAIIEEENRYISLAGFRIKQRQLGYAVISFVAFLLITLIALAAVLGSTSQKLNDARTATKITQTVTCKNAMCLETAARIVRALNTTVHPCDNFFEFACGNSDDSFYEIYESLDRQIEDRLVRIMDEPIGRYSEGSAERKIKEFYHTCDWGRYQGSQTLLNVVRTKMGGWSVVDPDWTNTTATSWDLNKALKAVQVDLLAEAFFSVAVEPSWWTYGNTIGIWPATKLITLFAEYRQLDSDNPKKRDMYQTAYRTYFERLARLMATDAGVTDPDLDNRIQTFASDVLEIGTNLSTFPKGLRMETLDQMTQRANNQINFTWILSALFKEAGVNGSSKVYSVLPEGQQSISTIIQHLATEGEAVKNRKLNNYLTWCVLDTFIEDLSDEYLTAKLQFNLTKSPYASFYELGNQDRSSACYKASKDNFEVALSALYVQTQFDKKNRAKVTDITGTMKTTLEKMVTTSTWMDQQTKDYAIAKIENATFLIGYPDFLANETAVDAIYAEITINNTDHMGNVLSLVANRRKEMNRFLMGTEVDYLNDHPLSTHFFLRPDVGDKLFVPAGELQFPLYTYDMPHYHSFGAIGTTIASEIQGLIDEYGNSYDKGGMPLPEGWWSNETMKAYKAVKACVGNSYKNALNTTSSTINDPYDSYDYESYDHLFYISGIKLAYKAYQLWQETHGSDPLPPVLDLTPQQVFFIANSQKFCSMLSWSHYNRQVETIRQNFPLQQLKEFQDAFQCKTGDNMVPTTDRCELFS